MEVDEEIEAGLLRQFNCLNTSDRDVLIKEFQGLVGRGPNLSEQTARFYLDMADWNLQAAICGYFDLQSSTRLPQMRFLQDVTIGEGESVPPDTSFLKTWRVENCGGEAWPEGCRLLHTGGERLGGPDASQLLQPLPPSTSLDVSITMLSPKHKGLYSSKWRMSTAQGHFFGDTIWVIIQVDDGGTLALMQQMVNLKELGSSPPQAPPPSPAHAFGGAASLPTNSPPSNPFCPGRVIGSGGSKRAASPSLQPINPPSPIHSIFAPSSAPSTTSNVFNNLSAANTDAVVAAVQDNSRQYYLPNTTTTNTISSSAGALPLASCTTTTAAFTHAYPSSAFNVTPSPQYFPSVQQQCPPAPFLPTQFVFTTTSSSSTSSTSATSNPMSAASCDPSFPSKPQVNDNLSSDPDRDVTMS